MNNADKLWIISDLILIFGIIIIYFTQYYISIFLIGFLYIFISIISLRLVG